MRVLQNAWAGLGSVRIVWPTYGRGSLFARGAEWVDELMLYLDGNRKIFDDAVNSIPGAASMNLEATYLPGSILRDGNAAI